MASCGTPTATTSRTVSTIQRGDIIIETIETSTNPQISAAEAEAEIRAALSQQSISATQGELTNSTVGGRVLENTSTDKIDTIVRIVNAFADLAKRVVAPDTPLMKGNIIAEARPAGLEPMALQNSKYSGKSYKKLFKSLLGFKLVEVEYKIAYSYGADNNGKGQYIPHVLFTPMKIVLDPLWHLEADSLSLAPRNCGTIEDPIAALEFNLAFKAKGLTGTIMATDTFSLNAQTGELVADGRDFQP
jgi:membrane-associated HD superfamily phosphohydrolase